MIRITTDIFFFVFIGRLGLKIAVADLDEEKLNAVGQELAETIGSQNVLVVPTDVSKLDQVVRLKEKVYDTWGEVWSFSILVLGRATTKEYVIGCSLDE